MRYQYSFPMMEDLTWFSSSLLLMHCSKTQNKYVQRFTRHLILFIDHLVLRNNYTVQDHIYILYDSTPRFVFTLLSYIHRDVLIIGSKSRDSRVSYIHDLVTYSLPR
jgi:hypothetical protein